MLTTSVTLLERVRQTDDQEAWQRFVAIYTPLLYRWARRSGMTEHDAADLVQDVFVVLTRALPGFQYDAARSNFRGWLKTITINKCREHRRRKTVAAAEGGSDNPIEDVADRGRLESFWEEEYRQRLTQRALEVMRSEFEPKTWQACWEHLVGDKTAADIGRDLGLSEAAVYVAKSRVLRRLRQELDGLLD